MQPRIKVLEMTCNACPTQWEGITEDGKKVYIRYRWSKLKLYIDDEMIVNISTGDGMDGVMLDSEMENLLTNYIDFP